MGKELTLGELKQAITELSPAEIPHVLAELEELRAATWARLLVAAANGQDHPGVKKADELVDVQEAAHRLQVSPDYLYRHSKQLPFTVRIGRRVRFSARGIERYIERRQGR